MNAAVHAPRRWPWTLAALLGALVAVSGLVDAAGADYAERAFGRALVTFAVARTLDGVVSVAQGTELAVEPAGVGVIFSLGQVLDPVNDLVERFSTVMLVATSSLGLQNLLLRLSGWWGTSGLVLASAAFLLARLWWPRAGGPPPGALPVRLLVIALALRFAVPLLVIGNTVIFDTFLAAEQEAAVRALEATSEEIEAVNEEATPRPPAGDSMLDRLGDWVDRSMASFDLEERLERLRAQLGNATEHIINLIVIFVFQTIVVPLAFLWLVVEALKSLVRRTTGIG